LRCSFFVPSKPLEVNCRRFSLNFLPDSESWELSDSRGSLLLLSKKFTCEEISHDYHCRCCPDLIVCDPLLARYQGILWPPNLDGLNRMGVFLYDDDDLTDRRVSLSNFRIIAAVEENIASVFTTGSDGGWRIVRTELPDDPEIVIADFFAGHVNSSFYWRVEEDSTMALVLDEATAVFSFTRLPLDVLGLSDEQPALFFGGEDGVLRVVRLIGNHLNVFARTHRDCSKDEG
jgi:hypothetical protein